MSKASDLISAEELKIISDMVVSLAAIKQKGCEHLCVENFAADCFDMLLRVYVGKDPADEPWIFRGRA